jgi:hypothetical protein
MIMPLQSKLRFATKVLVTAISLVGLTAAYFFVTRTPTDPAEGAQIIAIDHTPTASISHFPEESLAVEAASGVKTKPNGARKVEVRQGSKNQTRKIVLVNKAKKVAKTTQEKTSDLSDKKTSKGIKAETRKAVSDKKTPAVSAKNAPSKNDPIAGLLAKH